MNPAGEPGNRLEHHRHRLQVLAHLHVDPWLAGKLDLSGIVQQTLLEALQAEEPANLAAWLRRALLNNLADECRKLRTGKRDVARECSLELALERSSVRIEAQLAAEQSSPSERAEEHERSERLLDALAALPEFEREALVLQHWHGWTVAQIGERLERTPAAVAGLLKRGLARLRQSLHSWE
jgi:RNA polymerase sigma-70 factor (ECF subfamily)